MSILCLKHFIQLYSIVCNIRKKTTCSFPPPIYCHNFVAPPITSSPPPPKKKKTQATSRSKAKHQFTTPRVGLGIVEPQEKRAQSWILKRQIFWSFSKIMCQVCWHVAWVWILIFGTLQRLQGATLLQLYQHQFLQNDVRISSLCQQVLHSSPTVLSEREHSCEDGARKPAVCTTGWSHLSNIEDLAAHST